MTRANPELLVVTGLTNPPGSRRLVEAWKRFHQRDTFDGDVLRLPDVRGVPAQVFAIGRCAGIHVGEQESELGRGDRRPGIVAGEKRVRLWLVSIEPLDLHELADQVVHSVTYDPVDQSGKDRVLWKHEFESPKPQFEPLGSVRASRGAALTGGRYRIDDWLYD